MPGKFTKRERERGYPRLNPLENLFILSSLWEAIIDIAQDTTCFFYITNNLHFNVLYLESFPISVVISENELTTMPSGLSWKCVLENLIIEKTRLRLVSVEIDGDSYWRRLFKKQGRIIPVSEPTTMSSKNFPKSGTQTLNIWVVERSLLKQGQFLQEPRQQQGSSVTRACILIFIAQPNASLRNFGRLRRD